MKIALMKYKELQYVNRIPSYIYSFDYLTKGGIPEGRFTLFFGDKSTGKSTLSLRLAKSFLDANPDRNVVYVDFEQAFDRAWCEAIVGDTDRFYIVQPSYAEEGIELLMELTEKPEHGFYIIDSLAMVIPMKEAEAPADSSLVGVSAKAVSSLLRKMVPNVSKQNRNGNPVTVLLINQVRVNIGGYFSGYTKPGGKLQDALAALEIRFYVKEYAKGQETPNKVTYAFVIEKNKVGGIPKVVGEYTMALVNQGFYKAGDVMDELAIFNKLVEIGKIDKENIKFADKTYKNRKEFLTELYRNKALKLEAIHTIIKEAVWLSDV